MTRRYSSWKQSGLVFFRWCWCWPWRSQPFHRLAPSPASSRTGEGTLKRVQTVFTLFEWSMSLWWPTRAVFEACGQPSLLPARRSIRIARMSSGMQATWMAGTTRRWTGSAARSSMIMCIAIMVLLPGWARSRRSSCYRWMASSRWARMRSIQWIHPPRRTSLASTPPVVCGSNWAAWAPVVRMSSSVSSTLASGLRAWASPTV